MPHPVIWFEVVGKDIDGLKKFYGDLFDWNVDASNPMNYGMIMDNDEGISGGIGGAPDGAARVTWYVQVPDVDEHLKKANELGAKTITEPMDVPEGPRLAHFADQDGNVVGLMSPMQQQ